MKKAKTKIAKWGNSLGLRIPSSMVEALELKEGEEVTIEVQAKMLVIQRPKTRKPRNFLLEQAIETLEEARNAK